MLSQDTKTPATAPAAKTAPAKGGKTDLVQAGTAIITAMSDEERARLGSKSGTLHFIHLLGLQSRKANRVTKGGATVDSFTPVGVTLVSDEDIDVPVIDCTKNKETGIEPGDIGSRHIKAGETFDLTHYEFMYLIIRDEYSGVCTVGDDVGGVYFAAKTTAYSAGKTKLPTPTINFRGDGSPKSGMVPIDEKDENGAWRIKDEYAEKFGAMLRKRAPQRSGGGKSSNVPSPMAVAKALQEILHVNG